jgi:hypothetical protein
MADDATPQPRLVEPAAGPNDPGPRRLRVIDADRVGKTAADIGVPVPPGLLVAVGEDGNHLAMTAGSVADFRAAAGILASLDGKPASECVQGPGGSEPDAGPEPAWRLPDDFLENPEAQRAYLAEYAKHPEWPRIYNSTGNMLELAHAVALLGGGGAVSYAARDVIREWLRQRGETNRTRITEENETTRAAIRAESDANKPDNGN